MAKKQRKTNKKSKKIPRHSSIQKTIDQGNDYVARVDQRLRIRRNNQNKLTNVANQKQKKIAKVTKTKKQKRGVTNIPVRPARKSLPAIIAPISIPPTTSLFNPPATSIFAPAGASTGLFGPTRTASRNLSRSGTKNLAKSGSKNNQIIEQQLQDRLGRHNANIGKLNFSLRWWDPNDLDLHVICPCGTEIYFGNKKCTKCNGQLDIDMNVGMNMSLEPVEHVYFNAPKPGLYKFFVRYFSGPKQFQGVKGAQKSKYALSLHEDLNQIFRYQDNVSITQREIHYDFSR